jgi:hypothetical protein
MNITSTSIISRTTNIAQRLFEQHILVITPKNSMLHRFNEVGTFIWQQLAIPKSVGELCGAIMEHFTGVDEKQLEHDIVVFLSKLMENKLVECRNEREAG